MIDLATLAIPDIYAVWSLDIIGQTGPSGIDLPAPVEILEERKTEIVVYVGHFLAPRPVLLEYFGKRYSPIEVPRLGKRPRILRRSG